MIKTKITNKSKKIYKIYNKISPFKKKRNNNKIKTLKI